MSHLALMHFIKTITWSFTLGMKMIQSISVKSWILCSFTFILTAHLFVYWNKTESDSLFRPKTISTSALLCYIFPRINKRSHFLWRNIFLCARLFLWIKTFSSEEFIYAKDDDRVEKMLLLTCFVSGILLLYRF